MKIGEVAQATGLSVDTLRYYEKIGLIAPAARDDGGRRVYDDAALRWIAFLSQLNATGMKQADRIRYARLRRDGDATLRQRREMLEHHRHRIDAQIAALTDVRALMDRKIADYHRQEQERANDDHRT